KKIKLLQLRSGLLKFSHVSQADTYKEVLLTFSQKIMLDDTRIRIMQQVTRFIDSETICEQSRSLTF
ncbi:unnamed protein product, partial [Heterotrigona itama]